MTLSVGSSSVYFYQYLGKLVMNTQTFLFFLIRQEIQVIFSLFPTWQITVLQLSTLLKQADSSKRKLTLTRLASAPVPFTVLSLTGNPCNEDYLAVCGLKVRQPASLKWKLLSFVTFLSPRQHSEEGCGIGKFDWLIVMGVQDNFWKTENLGSEPRS